MAKQPVNPGDVDLDALPTPAPEGSNLGKDEAARPPPQSKTGSVAGDSAGDGAGGNATTRGPGGPDSGGGAMPGRSNAL